MPYAPLKPRAAIAKLPEWALVFLALSSYAFIIALTLIYARVGASVVTVMCGSTSWLAAWMLLLPTTRARLAVLLLGIPIDFALQWSLSVTFDVAVGFAIIDVCMVALAYLAVRWISGAASPFASISGLLSYSACAVVIGFTSAAMGMGASAFSNQFSSEFSRSWFFSVALGLIIFLPSLLILVSDRPTPQTQGSLLERIALPVLITGVTVMIIAAGRFELLIAIVPLLIAIAFRLGVNSAIVSFLLISISAISLNRLGYTSPTAAAGHLLSHLEMVQLFIAASFVASLPAAMAVSDAVRYQQYLLAEQETANEAKRAADLANAAKSDFIATMSHEMRSPLNVIVGFTHLLQQRPEMSSQAKMEVRSIETASRALLTVVNDVLDYSSLERGHLQLNPQPFSIHDCGEATVALLAGEARRKSIALQFKCAPELEDLWVIGDADRLRQIILNMLSNAVKLTEKGFVRLTMARVPDATPGSCPRIRVEVSDTGPGIAERDLPLLFQRFTQLDSSSNRRHSGTGLGLAICKNLVETMNGEIGVESEAGRGSMFWFEVSLPSSGRPPQRSATQPNVRSPGASLLVVDDVELNRVVTQAILQRCGYKVEVASGGGEAIDAVESGGVDLVLMDLQMPVIDGYEATRRIRANDSHLPIVAISANVRDEDVMGCFAVGMNAHLGKPFDPATMVEVIEQQLARSRKRRPQAHQSMAEAGE